MADISYFPAEMLVWVDETGCDRRDILRKSGYAFRGATLTLRGPPSKKCLV